MKLNSWYEVDNYLADFLVGQKNLEELIWDSPSLTLFPAKKLNLIQFPLKKLSFNSHGNSHESEDKILLFLSKFAETLEELKLETLLPDSVYKLIFSKFRKLKTLIITLNAVCFQNIPPNFSVQKLEILDSDKINFKSFEGIIGSLPRVEILTLKYGTPSQEFLKFISANLLELKELHLDELNPKSFVGVTIASLKSISIKKLTYKLQYIRSHTLEGIHRRIAKY